MKGDIRTLTSDYEEANRLSATLDWERGRILGELRTTLGREFAEFAVDNLHISRSQASRYILLAEVLPSDCGLSVSQGYLAARAVKMGTPVDEAIELARILSLSDFNAHVLGNEQKVTHSCTCDLCGKVHNAPGSPTEV